MSVIAGYMSSDTVFVPEMPPVINFDANHNATPELPLNDSDRSATASPQKASINDELSLKPSTTNSLRRSSRKLFGRLLLEKTMPPDAQDNALKDKPVNSPTAQPLSQIEIINSDGTSQTHSVQDSQNLLSVSSQARDELTLPRPSSVESGERTPSTISDESAPPLSPVICTQAAQNFGSVPSSVYCTERVVKVLKEMIETERTYVKSLEEIIKGYVTHMRKHTSVSKQRAKELFMNIEEIHTFNREFLAELEECIDNPVEVANKFVLKGKGFEVTYTEYCTKYPKAVEVLTDFTRNRETASFLQKIQAKLGHSLPLGSYMLKPVQRILKYHLLWQDIKKHYDQEEDPDGYDLICDALLAMTSVATYINEMKRKHEATLHVQEIQSQLSDFEGPDLTTYGELVLEDTFRMSGTKTERYLILFEKIILITKRRDSGFMCKATLMLSNMMLSESIPKEPLGFQIIKFNNQKITYTFLAKNMEQKRKWTLEIKRLIVESFAAQVKVPEKVKDQILGKGNTNTLSTEDYSEPSKRKRSKSEGWGPNMPQSYAVKGFTGNMETEKKETNREKRNSETEKDDDENTRSADQPCHENEGGLSSKTASDDVKLEENSGKEPIRNETDGEGEHETGLGTRQDESETNPHQTGSEAGEDSTQSRANNHTETEKRDDTSGVSSRKARRTVSVDSMRDRPSSFTEAQTHGRRRHYTAFGGADIAKELGKLGVASIRERTALNLKRTWSLDAKTMEKASSTSDLFHLRNDLLPVFSRPLEGITGNSTIKKTVRKVSQAFGETETGSPPDWTFSVPSQENAEAEAAQEIPSPDNALGSSSSPEEGSHGSLENILASVERDIDETRRTINNAQLLESALRLKNNPSKTEPPSELSKHSTELMNMKLRAMERMKKHRERMLETTRKSEFFRPKEFLLEPAESAEVSDSRENSREHPRAAREYDMFQQMLETANKRSSELQRIHNNTLEKMKKRKEQRGECTRQDRHQKARSSSETFSHVTQARSTKVIDFSLSSFERKSVSVAENEARNPQTNDIVTENDHFSISNAELLSEPLKSRKRLIDIFVEEKDSNVTDYSSPQTAVEAAMDEWTGSLAQNAAEAPKDDWTDSLAQNAVEAPMDDWTGSLAHNAAVEELWPITPQRWELPNVRNIARQFSKIIHDQEQVSEIRKHAQEVKSADSLKIDPSPTVHIERVTKVTLESCPSGPNAETRLVRRRRKPRRHKFGDTRRSSWSCDQDETKTKGKSGKEVRPKSVFVRQPPAVKVIEQSEDADEESAESKRIDEKEKEDVVIEGLVQHLVNMFESS